PTTLHTLSLHDALPIYEDIAVMARIYSIAGFSAHADQNALLAWHNAIANVKTTFLVHGEMPAMQTFAKLLPGSHVELPAPNQALDRKSTRLNSSHVKIS